MKRQEPAGTIEGVELERVIEFLKERGPPPPRRKPTKSQPYTDQESSAADTQFRIGMQGRLATADVLANPAVTRQQILDRPFLIWSYPLSDILVGSNVESMNSSARISVYANEGATNTRVTFHFFWTNENASPAVVTINSQLVFTGDCFAQARAGIFSGYETKISLSATLHMLRAGGWGNDPVTGNQTYVPPTQSTSVAGLWAKGGHLFQGVGTDSESFAAQPFEIGHNSLLVPAGASVIFGSSLYVYYSLEGDTIEDVVEIDFAKNGRAVRCPFVALTIQTPT